MTPGTGTDVRVGIRERAEPVKLLLAGRVPERELDELVRHADGGDTGSARGGGDRGGGQLARWRGQEEEGDPLILKDGRLVARREVSPGEDGQHGGLAACA